MQPLCLNPRKKIILAIAFLVLTQLAGAQDNAIKKRCNFYVFTQDADKKFDLIGFTTLARIHLKCIIQQTPMYVIIARNSGQVAAKISSILESQHAGIGNIWFDSHGLYKQGYSSFHIGRDEFSYKNINDTAQTAALYTLAKYCDSTTNIGLGSCYAGATFHFPGSNSAPPGRMNGDSLMIGVGKIFSGATIYGSESWVMAKPGIFNDNFGFAGYPLGAPYRTAYWKPVWERLGQWNSYSTGTGVFKAVNTVALDGDGNILVRSRNYQQLSKGQKAVAKNLQKLQGEVN